VYALAVALAKLIASMAAAVVKSGVVSILEKAPVAERIGAPVGIELYAVWRFGQYSQRHFRQRVF